MRRFAVFPLLAALLLTLAACTVRDDPDDIEVGGDWRTWGVINDYGTIVRDGAETTVCVCICDSTADFYLDREEQTVYASVQYPSKIDSASAYYQSVSFADLNKDGNSDVQITFSFGDGGETKLTWLWENSEFVYHAELSDEL